MIIIYSNSVHIRLTIEDNGKKELNFHTDTGVAHQFTIPAKNIITP